MTEQSIEVSRRDGREASECGDLLQGAFPMETAPKDGTKIEILFRHMNYKFAAEHEKDDWQQWCEAYWIDFNGGGWTWRGICGVPVCWRTL